MTALIGGSRFDGDATWSPDGRSVVFDTNASGRFELYLLPLGGSPPRRLAVGAFPTGRPTAG